jgi:hypothetical protein
MTSHKDEPVRALVGFGSNNVGLYLLHIEETGSSFLRRNLVLEMPRDGNRREDDPNVQYVHNLADAINKTTAAFLASQKVPA